MIPVYTYLKSPKGIAITLVLLAVAFNAVFLWAEFGVSTFNPNDNALHLTNVQETSNAIRQGVDPTDFWLAQIGLGYPLSHYYPHLPAAVIGLVNQITGVFLPLSRLFDLSQYLLLVLFPVSIYWAMRRFGFDYLAAGISALVVSLLSANHLYGIDSMSYLWQGVGLYTQLWAMFFLLPALAEVYQTMKGNGLWFRSVLLSSFVLLSNLMYGYILVVSVILFVFLTPNIQEIVTRLKKTVLIFILTFCTTAYFFIPFLLDQSYLNRSVLEDPVKYTSYGAVNILTNLFTGTLFDYNRLPVLTILFFIAMVFVVLHWKQEKFRLLIVLTVFWLLVYFGPATWGDLTNLLPFSQDIHFHRFAGMFQISAVMVLGAGLSLFFDRITRVTAKSRLRVGVIAGIIFLLILTPVFFERMQYYQLGSQQKIESQNAFLSDSNEIIQIKETLAALPRGRVYAGLPSDFGADLRYCVGGVPMYSILPQMGIDTFGYAYTAFPLVSDVRLYFNTSRVEQYNLFNIKYVILQKSWTPAFYYTKIKEFEHFDLYQVPTTGYFDLVDVPAVFYGNKTTFFYPNVNWLSSDLPLQKQNPMIVIGDRSIATAHGLPVYSFQNVTPEVLASLSLRQSAGGEIVNESVLPNEYRAEFTVTRTSYLLLKTNYHPKWEVTVDTKKVVPVMLAPGFIGVPVTPGIHTADFVYHAPTIRLPLFVFGMVILILLIVFDHINSFCEKKVRIKPQ